MRSMIQNSLKEMRGLGGRFMEIERIRYRLRRKQERDVVENQHFSPSASKGSGMLQYYIYERVSSIKKLAYSNAEFGI